MRNTKSKFCALLLSGVMAFSLAGCGGAADTGTEPGGSSPLTAADIDVWSTYATEKVLRDLDYETRGEKKIEIEMYRNETEGGQIVLTPSKDVKAFTAVMTDLTASDGTVLSKDCVEVLFEKYVEVKTMTKGDDISEFPHGWYPDALIPMEKAVEYGENTIAAGDNQGLYVSVTTPEDQNAGVYNGTLKVTADGVAIDIPVSVTVWDWTMPTENHLLSCYDQSIVWGGWGGLNACELDDTIEIQEAYYDFLLDFRVMQRFLPMPMVPRSEYRGEGSLDAFIERAVIAAKDPRVSSYCLPYKIIASQYNIDMGYYDHLICAMMKASIENDVDMFAKAYTYFTEFDEANGNATKMKYAQNILLGVKEYKESFLAKHQADFTDLDEYTEEKFEEYYASFMSMTQLYVGYYMPELEFNQQQEKYDYTWCTFYSQYNTEELRDVYLNQPGDRDIWWYGCMNPKNPHPTYHIDDWGYSPRMVGWEQFEYGINADLFWQCTYWSEGSGASQKAIQDLYSVAMHYTGHNGDGYLLYPGKYYGIQGPVASIRLHAIRDGKEDYEAMLALKEKTDALIAKGNLSGSTVNAIIPLLDSLFTGTVIHTDSASLLDARRQIAKLLTAADLGAVIFDSELDGNERTFKVFAEEGTTVTASGATSEAVTGGTVYTITVNNNTEGAKLSFTATKGDKSADAYLALGDRRQAITADAFKTGSQLIDKDAVVTTDNGEYKIAFSDPAGQRLLYRDASMASLDTSRSEYEFTFTNYGAEDIKVYVKGMGTNGSTATDITYITVKPGVSRSVKVQLSMLPWKSLGNLNGLMLEVSSTEAATLGITGINVTM